MPDIMNKLMGKQPSGKAAAEEGRVLVKQKEVIRKANEDVQGLA